MDAALKTKKPSERNLRAEHYWSCPHVFYIFVQSRFVIRFLMKVVLNANSMEQNRRARKNASIGPSNTIEAILRIRPIQFDLHPERGRRRDRHRWGGRVEELQYRRLCPVGLP